MSAIVLISALIGLSLETIDCSHNWWTSSAAHWRPKRSIVGDVYNSVDAPEVDDITNFGWFPKTGNEDLWRQMLCTDEDHNCIDEDAIAQRGPEDAKKEADESNQKRMSRDKQVKEAVEEGERRGKKDLEAAGGPDPYAGYFLPNAMRAGERMAEEVRKYKKAHKEEKTTAKSKKNKKER